MQYGRATWSSDQQPGSANASRGPPTTTAAQDQVQLLPQRAQEHDTSGAGLLPANPPWAPCSPQPACAAWGLCWT